MNPRGLILPSRILGGFILAMAVIPLVIGVWLVSNTRAFIQGATPTTATVIELVPSSSSDGTTYSSIFQFQDQHGQTHAVTSSWSSNPPAHTVGERIDVLYHPDNPTNAVIDSFFALWIGPIICGALTLVPLFAGMCFVWFVPFTLRRVWPDQAPAEPTHGAGADAPR